MSDPTFDANPTDTTPAPADVRPPAVPDPPAGGPPDQGAVRVTLADLIDLLRAANDAQQREAEVCWYLVSVPNSGSPRVLEFASAREVVRAAREEATQPGKRWLLAFRGEQAKFVSPYSGALELLLPDGSRLPVLTPAADQAEEGPFDFGPRAAPPSA